MDVGPFEAGPTTSLKKAITAWYRRHKRDLPWRRTRDPYAILVSEVMLQQTQVERVMPKYLEFLNAFPNVRSLARARLADVIRSWSGLGYNARARRLWLAAKELADGGGRVPHDEAALARLPGIGAYTAAAVASFAFGRRTTVVDTNVRRVLGRAVLGRDGIPQSDARKVAADLVPLRDAGEWHQALMDLGARHCRARPLCDGCPARRACAFVRVGAPLAPRVKRATPPFKTTTRYFRGRIVAALRTSPSLSLLALGAKVKDRFSESDLPWLHAMLERLERDGLIAVDGDSAALP